MKRVLPQFLSRRMRLRRWLDWRSLQGRLTISLAVLMTLSLGGMTLWTVWQMRQMLVNSHKQEMATVAQQLNRDLSIYLDMFSVQESLQRSLNKRARPGLLMWVRDQQNQVILAEAPNMKDNSLGVQDPQVLARVVKVGWAPDIYQIRDRNMVACHTALRVDGQKLGYLYLAEDITEDQARFYHMVKALVLGMGVAVLVTPIIMALAVQRWLCPLTQMWIMTQDFALDNPQPTQVEIKAAPQELQDILAKFNLMIAHFAEVRSEQQAVGERQRQFISNVSHELRTPLTIVRGYLQSTLRRSDNLSDHQREGLEIAASEADQTIQLLQDLLSLARADDGYMPCTLQPLVLNDVVSDVVHMAEQFSHRTILVEAEAPLIPVFADAKRLQQVLVNLVENALKYSDEPVTLTLKQAEDLAVIQVCDRGPGIPLKQQSRIFERFYRLDEARTRSTGGTGLGLSIVKTFVEGMGGTVNVLSKPGEGSTFTVTLPAFPKSP